MCACAFVLKWYQQSYGSIHTCTHACIHLHIRNIRPPTHPHSQVVCSFLQLGFITMFFSDALISGYTTAAGFHALTSQFKYVFDFNMTGIDSSGEDKVYIPEIPKVAV